MSEAKKEYSQDESFLMLMNVPNILKSSELVQALEENFKFAGNNKPSIMLRHWEITDKTDKFQVLGWIEGGLVRLRFRAIQYIDLISKIKFEYAIIAVLQNATEEEREIYERELNQVVNQKR